MLQALVGWWRRRAEVNCQFDRKISISHCGQGRRSHLRKIVLFCAAGSIAMPAVAGEKPPLAPDQPSALTIPSRISAVVEFGLPAVASAIERDIPKRLATIGERIGCVNRRVLVFRIRANCDVDGFVDRGPMSLSGRGDRIVGSVPIFGAIEGQGANRFTSRIHGDAQGRAMVEVESRPKLTKDWSVDLNFSNSFHWTEPPVLHVLGRDIAADKIRRAKHPKATRPYPAARTGGGASARPA